MSLKSRLAVELLRAHPIRAALALERIGFEATKVFFEICPVEDQARTLPHLSTQFASSLCAALDVEKQGEMLERLPIEMAARVLRSLGGSESAALAHVSDKLGLALARLVRYPEDSAGGLMDPNVLALPAGFTAAEAIERLRELSQHARYNVYVVDNDDVLVGVLNLRELFLARDDALLGDLMVRNPERIQAHAMRRGIIAHRGWRLAHALPVVDEQGHYLGAIRYRTLRMLEADDAAHAEPSSARDLGELFSVGAGGALRAISGDKPPGNA